MRNYGAIHTCFWIHPEIQKLNDSAKLLAVYLLTGPHTNMLGCFRLPLGYIGEDLDWESEIIASSLESLLGIHFATYDYHCHWIFLQQFLIWNPIENPNQGKNIIRLFEQVPKKACFFESLVDTLIKIDKYLTENFKDFLSTYLSKQAGFDAAPDVADSITVIQDTKKTDAIVIRIPLNDQSEFPIAQSKVDEWQKLYPAVDVIQSLRNIRAWNDANPTRRKTKSGILRHVVAWLSKEQNQSRQHLSTNSKIASFERIQTHNLHVARNWLDRSKQLEKKREIIIPSGARHDTTT
jgi:hypothetical protein